MSSSTQGQGPWSAADYRNGADIESDQAYARDGIFGGLLGDASHQPMGSGPDDFKLAGKLTLPYPEDAELEKISKESERKELADKVVRLQLLNKQLEALGTGLTGSGAASGAGPRNILTMPESPSEPVQRLTSAAIEPLEPTITAMRDRLSPSTVIRPLRFRRNPASSPVVFSA